MRSSLLLTVSLASLLPLLGQRMLGQSSRLDPSAKMHITLPENSPVTVLAADWGESNASPRGGAMLLDLHTSLSLKNTSSRRIRGVTLLVTAQEATPGGKASVTVPSLNIGQGEAFPVRIDLRLLQPLHTGNGPLVEIGLDGVLFEDLSFFGPDTLNSRRSMTVWELEAKRDRRHFRQVLETAGADGLRTEMLASLNRQAERSGMEARVSQQGRATNTSGERQVQFAFLELPGGPIEPQGGMVRVAGDEARSPRVFLYNRSDRTVRGLEIGWMVKDARGKDFVAGAVPVPLSLAPRQKTTLVQDASFRFSQASGQPIQIDSITGFVNSVEYADGTMWVPNRSAKMPTPSPEEHRLGEMYRTKGLKAVIAELDKF